MQRDLLARLAAPAPAGSFDGGGARGPDGNDRVGCSGRMAAAGGASTWKRKGTTPTTRK